MLFTSRSRRAPDRYLPFKTAALLAAIALLLVSERTGNRVLGWIAIALLGVAFGLRFLPQRPRRDGGEGEEGTGPPN